MCKSELIYYNIQKLQTQLTKDLRLKNENTQLTALAIQIMKYTADKIGTCNLDDSTSKFGVTNYQCKHFTIDGTLIHLKHNYNDKYFSDAVCSRQLQLLIKRDKGFIFQSNDGFVVLPNTIARYLRKFNLTSKDIRGHKANKHIMIELSNRQGKIHKAERQIVFDSCLCTVSNTLDITPELLRRDYLLPKIEDTFIAKGHTKNIRI